MRGELEDWEKYLKADLKFDVSTLAPSSVERMERGASCASKWNVSVTNCSLFAPLALGGVTDPPDRRGGASGDGVHTDVQKL